MLRWFGEQRTICVEEPRGFRRCGLGRPGQANPRKERERACTACYLSCDNLDPDGTKPRSSAMARVCQGVYDVFYAPNVVLPFPSSLTGLYWAPCSLPFRQPRRGLPYNCGHSHGVIHTPSHSEIRLACKRQFYPGYNHLHGVQLGLV